MERPNPLGGKAAAASPAGPTTAPQPRHAVYRSLALPDTLPAPMMQPFASATAKGPLPTTTSASSTPATITAHGEVFWDADAAAAAARKATAAGPLPSVRRPPLVSPQWQQAVGQFPRSVLLKTEDIPTVEACVHASLVRCGCDVRHVQAKFKWKCCCAGVGGASSTFAVLLMAVPEKRDVLVLDFDRYGGDAGVFESATLEVYADLLAAGLALTCAALSKDLDHRRAMDAGEATTSAAKKPCTRRSFAPPAELPAVVVAEMAATAAADVDVGGSGSNFSSLRAMFAPSSALESQIEGLRAVASEAHARPAARAALAPLCGALLETAATTRDADARRLATTAVASLCAGGNTSACAAVVAPGSKAAFESLCGSVREPSAGRETRRQAAATLRALAQCPDPVVRDAGADAARRAASGLGSSDEDVALAQALMG